MYLNILDLFIFIFHYIIKKIIIINIFFFNNYFKIFRLLVGLRWWSEPQPTGKDKWVFECKVDENSNNPVDSKIFWFVQITFTLGWLALAFYNIFTLDITDVFIYFYHYFLKLIY